MNLFIQQFEIWIAVSLAGLLVFVSALTLLLCKRDQRSFSVFADTPSEGTLGLHPLRSQKISYRLQLLIAWLFAVISVLVGIYPLLKEIV